MSRVEDLKQQIEELENKRTELIKELEVEKQKKEIDYPFNYKENCYLLTSNGDIAEDWWSSSGNDRKIYRQGNFFKTKEDATREHYRRELLTRFRQFRDKCNGDWKPNFDNDKWNTYIAFHHNRNKLEIHSCCNLEEFALFGYFRNDSDEERAIELFGDEIKRLFVEEEE